MMFDISMAINWILFLALFPMAFIWLRRAFRIIVRRNFDEVALKRGVPPDNPEKFAPYAAAINLIAGTIAASVILAIIFAGLHYDTWTAIAGSTIWMKFFADFILGRHAHPAKPAEKKAAEQ